VCDVRRDAEWVRERFGAARIARMATMADGRPRLVPVVYALVGATIYTAVDGKPKRTTELARLDDIAADPSVCLLVDAYDEDWTQLWWARADATARIAVESAEGVAALRNRYPQYASVALPGPVIVAEVTRWSGWSAQ
jgi:PPOX class probable F420-dependent enzyme